MVAPSSHPKPRVIVLLLAVTNVTFCKNILITDSKFGCTVTDTTYFIKGKLSCDSCNVLYLITCYNCREQYVGSAINFKQRFRVYKSDIKTNKVRCMNVAVLIINMLI